MRGALLLVLLLVAGCGDRRTFDERFNDTELELRKRSAELDRKLEEQGNLAGNTAGNNGAR